MLRWSEAVGRVAMLRRREEELEKNVLPDLISNCLEGLLGSFGFYYENMVAGFFYSFIFF